MLNLASRRITDFPSSIAQCFDPYTLRASQCGRRGFVRIVMCRVQITRVSFKMKLRAQSDEQSDDSEIAREGQK